MRFKDKIAKLREEITRLNAIDAEMMKSEDKQISLTDPDARSMATSGKDAGIVGYNVQAAVDTKNHLIGPGCVKRTRYECYCSCELISRLPGADLCRVGFLTAPDTPWGICWY